MHFQWQKANEAMQHSVAHLLKTQTLTFLEFLHIKAPLLDPFHYHGSNQQTREIDVVHTSALRRFVQHEDDDKGSTALNKTGRIISLQLDMYTYGVFNKEPYTQQLPSSKNK